jgi:predicted permease
VAIFSVINAVLLNPLPYHEPERLVSVWNTAPGLGMDQLEQSDATYLLYRQYNHALADLGLYGTSEATLTGDQEPERVPATAASASMFSVLGVQPLLGRGLDAGDEKPGAEPVAVLSQGLWRRRFGDDPKVLGSLLRIDGVSYRIVGVMPEAFRFPAPDTALWHPLPVDPARLAPGDFNYRAVGRLHSGTTPEQASRDLSSLVLRLPEIAGEGMTRETIESARLAAVVRPLRDDVVGDVARILWILLGNVGAILLIACANVANLFLVRAEARHREVAVRTSLGASPGAIARLFLAESLSLALIAGALGLALAAVGIRVLVSLRPEGIPRLDEIGIDGKVIAFVVGLSLFSGLLFGSIAVLRHSRQRLAESLKEGGRGGTAGRARNWARHALVAAQMALALVLLVGSGLMVRSFYLLHDVNPGFDPRGVLTARLSLPETEYKDAQSNVTFVRQLLERVEALPGVASAGMVSVLPLSGLTDEGAHTIEGVPVPPGSIPPVVSFRFVSPGYFKTMGIPVLQGKTFDPLDPGKPLDSAIVSTAFADRFWRGQDPLGRRVLRGEASPEARWFHVVGLAGSVRDAGLQEKPAEAVYYPLLRMPATLTDQGGRAPRNLTLVVRAQGNRDPAALAGAVRQAVWSLNPNLPVSELRTIDEVMARSTARTTFTMLLLVVAAAVALLLGAVGLYSVVAYVVSQRTREIGVRMALGAAQRDVFGMVLRQGLTVALIGIAIGVAVALTLTRLMAALLFEVSPTDLATFAAVPALLALVALLASYLPARRASLVAPLEAIRYE